MEQNKDSNEAELVEHGILMEQDTHFAGGSLSILVLLAYIDTTGFGIALMLLIIVPLFFLSGMWNKAKEYSSYRNTIVMVAVMNGLGMLIAMEIKSIWPIIIFFVAGRSITED